jgi:hypothetical protein
VKVDISTSIGEMDIVVGEAFTAQVQNFLANYNILEKKSVIISVWHSVAAPDPSDPCVFGPPGSRSGSFYHQAKKVRKTFLLFCDFFLTFYL